MRTSAPTILLVALVFLAAVPAPGDAQRFDVCAPLGVRPRCASIPAKRFYLASLGTAKCHVFQARVAFSGGTPFDEEGCESEALAHLRQLPAVCDPTITRAVTGLAAELEELLDRSVNGSLFCDATSGNVINPTGDDAGFVPATRADLECSQRVDKEVRKLTQAAVRCLSRNPRVAPFVAECLDKVRMKYDRATSKSVHPARGTCPTCLQDAVGPVADAVLALLDTHRESFSICLSGYFFKALGPALDLAPPTTKTHARALVQRVNKDEAATFPIFTSEPLLAATVLDAAGLVVVHLAANQPMKDCADVHVEVERVAQDGARSTLGAAHATGLTLPQASAKPSFPLGLDLMLAAASVPAGDRLAATVVVTNRCQGNRGISLDYDARSAPSRIVVNPASTDPTPTPTATPSGPRAHW